MNFSVEPMRTEDWPAVRSIFEEGIASGISTFETTAPSWDEWDQNHLPACRWAARADGQVVGWAALSPVSKRKAYAGVAEVSIYVASRAHRQGVGRALLLRLIDSSEQAGLWTLQATIFAANPASRALHLACGFREVGMRERIARRGGAWHDTVLYERRSPMIE